MYPPSICSHDVHFLLYSDRTKLGIKYLHLRLLLLLSPLHHHLSSLPPLPLPLPLPLPPPLHILQFTLLTNRIIRLPPPPPHKRLRLSRLHPILLYTSPIRIIIVLIVLIILILHLTSQIRIILIILIIVFAETPRPRPSQHPSCLPHRLRRPSLLEILLVRLGHDFENRLLPHRLVMSTAEGPAVADLEAGAGACCGSSRGSGGAASGGGITTTGTTAGSSSSSSSSS
ncbi:hypothetical protein B0T20DRAFT_422897 [Sordaria brevicollis]|uniref:Uncharacterized protein n=1 Tax=Sordaria brevicollis TaxID=83679 RepID=A0AAE0P2G3_SORBR|nr:hypothetical protein B0T20DRAFT_422897 [Sordaria brevicollis]